MSNFGQAGHVPVVLTDFPALDGDLTELTLKVPVLSRMGMKVAAPNFFESRQSTYRSRRLTTDSFPHLLTDRERLPYFAQVPELLQLEMRYYRFDPRQRLVMPLSLLCTVRGLSIFPAPPEAHPRQAHLSGIFATLKLLTPRADYQLLEKHRLGFGVLYTLL